MATKFAYVERGYGQVEPNHLSAQRTAQIYAQLPMGAGIDQLENGQFAKYDYENNEVNFAGEGEWMLVFNAVKVYDEDEDAADYAMIRPAEGAKGTPVIGVSTDVVPRLFKTNVGDIFTTNAIKEADGINTGVELKIDDNGCLSTAGTSDMKWQIVKVYTMPDGQKGVKIMRIA